MFWRNLELKGKYINESGNNNRYIIYDNGDLFDTKLNKFCTKSISHKGYVVYSIYLNGKSHTKSAHRLLMETFCPVENMENLQVNHIDCNKQNNDISNLEWCTQSENQKHAFSHGLISRKGIKNSQAKLSEKEVIEIANWLLDGKPIAQIAKEYNVSKALISRIRNKTLWKDLLKNYNFPESKYCRKDFRKT